MRTLPSWDLPGAQDPRAPAAQSRDLTLLTPPVFVSEELGTGLGLGTLGLDQHLSLSLLICVTLWTSLLFSVPYKEMVLLFRVAVKIRDYCV